MDKKWINWSVFDKDMYLNEKIYSAHYRCEKEELPTSKTCSVLFVISQNL